MVDGIKLHNFMVALTKVMAAAIAQDDPDAGTRDAQRTSPAARGTCASSTRANRRKGGDSTG